MSRVDLEATVSRLERRIENLRSAFKKAVAQRDHWLRWYIETPPGRNLNVLTEISKENNELLKLLEFGDATERREK